MKKILITLLIEFLLASCNDNEAELEYVDIWNQIELAHTDDKYGEWGGDTDIILVYSDGKKYYANYSKYLGSYETPKPPKPPNENEKVKKWYEYKKLEQKIDSIELNSESIQLIKDAIIYLTEEKITNSSFPSNAGISNSVISRDSSLIIDNYPSDEWKPFQQLKSKLGVK
jgi:hypothetical protein